MKRTGLGLLALLWLVMVCGACGGAAPEAAQGTLVVGDGTTSKTYTVADLQKLPVSESVFNEVTYKGVSLSALLGDARFDAGALKAVKAVAADGYTVNYDPALFQRSDVLVSYASADGSLSTDDGVLRMVLPGEEGKLNVRMLVELKVVP
jgi:DMSO/TMAO reductase YedYZ molybdopterin-dependent catalytic subunit